MDLIGPGLIRQVRKRCRCPPDGRIRRPRQEKVLQGRTVPTDRNPPFCLDPAPPASSFSCPVRTRTAFAVAQHTGKSDGAHCPARGHPLSNASDRATKGGRAGRAGSLVGRVDDPQRSGDILACHDRIPVLVDRREEIGDDRAPVAPYPGTARFV